MPMTAALALALACVLGQCSAFNLGVKFPLAFSSPKDDDSFGISVLLQADTTGRSPPWIQIGAPTPRRNGTKLPGKVYRCPIGDRCKEVRYEKMTGTQGYAFEDFVGGAMASQSPEKPGTVVVCGSRWHNSAPHSGTYPFVGACNWMDAAEPGMTSSPPNDWLFPLLDKGRAQSTSHSPAVFDWAIGQAGFSAHFPWKHQSTVVLGAPGVENWRGAVVYCQSNSYYSGGGARRRRQLRPNSGRFSLDGPECKVPPLSKYAVAEFDYLGYQVSSGEFFNKGERLLVASAPRAGKDDKVLYGMVRLFKLPPPRNEAAMSAENSLVGRELGSYFGASLAVGDFNGDGFDDLAVGAPLTTNTAGTGLPIPDAGTVHVFIGGDRTTLELQSRLEGKAAGGRFGHAIACPGDLDKDGYADLVVGAPYEDSERGAVYVFSGGPTGLSPTPSQRILARDLNSLGKGFGVSLSPAVDIDGNKFRDLAVGSHGAVVLLRAHPVVELRTTVSAQLNRVPQNATKVTITACVAFEGVDAPREIDVIRSVDVSSGLDIAQLIDPVTKQQTKALVSNVHLSQAESCSQLDIHIKEGSKYQDSILVQVSARLDNRRLDSTRFRVINGESMVDDKFCKNCPVERRPKDPTQMRLEFENDCKNQTCIADLSLRWHFMRDGIRTESHVVGSLKQIHLVVSAENQGEPAYSTYLVVAVPPVVSLASVPSNCEVDALSNRLRCELRDLTPERSSSSVSLSLDMSDVLTLGVGSGDGTLNFVVSAHTRSQQLVEDNRITAKLTLTREAKLAIYGKAVGRASYRYASANVSAQQVDFAHEFSVDKVGESPIDDAVVRVDFPYGWRRGDVSGALTTFLYARQPEVFQDGQSLTCTSTEAYLNETAVGEGTDSDIRSRRETPASGGDHRELLAAGDAVKLPANETFFLQCGTSGVLCGRISCNAQPFREDSTVRITIRMQFDVAMAAGLLQGKTIVSLTTIGDVIWDGAKEKSVGNATTIFVGAAEVKEVANWIIALSIAGGLLLFFFVVMALIKAGFFQRKQKMEMEALIEQEEEIKAINRQSQMPQNLDSDGDE